MVDPPSLPDKPSFPDRFKFSLGAIAAGLALAVLFGFGSEVLDDRIRSEQALTEAVNLPVLCGDSCVCRHRGKFGRPDGNHGWP